MIDFQQKRNIRKIIFSKLMLVVLFLLIVFVGKGVYRVYKSESMSRENLANVEAKYSELLERRGMLEESIESLGTEEGVEEEIRQKFGVAKEGESVIIMIEDKNATSETSDVGGFDLWKKVKSFFK